MDTERFDSPPPTDERIVALARDLEPGQTIWIDGEWVLLAAHYPGRIESYLGVIFPEDTSITPVYLPCAAHVRIKVHSPKARVHHGINSVLGLATLIGRR